MRRGMTTGWGTKVARAFSAASGAVLVAVLAGCSLGGSTLDGPEAAPSTSTPADTHSADGQPGPAPGDQPAFHFRSGDLVLGDFTYDDVAGDIFNPCEEISAEEFAAIGFEADGQIAKKRAEEKLSCRLIPHDNDNFTDLIVYSGPANFSDVSAQTEIYGLNVSEIVPGIYTHGPSAASTDFCFASVDTKRGQFSIVAGSAESSEPLNDRCSRAVKTLETLYKFE